MWVFCRGQNRYSTFAVISVVMLMLGCAQDLRQASSFDIQQQTVQVTTGDNKQAWLAPELQQRKFRLLFYGNDTVYYRLVAFKKPDNAKSDEFRLVINANYGLLQSAKIHHHDQVKLAGGGALPTDHRRLDTERCQVFSTMNNACLYRDRAEIELSTDVLTAAQQTGLLLTLGSTENDYEQIDLPASYITGFLQALQ